MLQKFTKVVRETLDEPGTGILSWGRVASSIALIASIVWVTKVLLLTGHLPPMDGITGYVIGPYTANKAATAVSSFSGTSRDAEKNKENHGNASTS
jgi:hypothetical protein